MAKIRAWDSPLNAFERILHRRKDFLLLEKEKRDGRLTKQHYHLKMLNTSGWEGSFGENMAESLCCPPGGITTLLIVLSSFRCAQLFTTLWIVAHQVPLSTGFSRHEYWSGLLWLSPGELSEPGIEPTSSVSPALQADSLLLSHQGNPYQVYSTIK